MSSIEICVKTSLDELRFLMPTKKAANELFLEICKNMGLRETWFFGLYFPENDNKIWIDSSKKKLSNYRNNAKQFRLNVKYYPESVETDLIENITIKYFFLQLRKEIIEDVLYCPPETCILLASYAVQTKHGDECDDIVLSPHENLLPERVYKQHNMDKETFTKTITKMWKRHRGLTKEDAMVEYLKLAENLEMFGIHYFPITNSKGAKVLLGVMPLGLNIYVYEDKLNPIIAFPWAEIAKLDFRGKKFLIKTSDKDGKDFIFFSEEQRNNKRILNLGIGYHMLYINRRKEDSYEKQQMRKHAKAQKEMMEQQKLKLRREIEARNVLEQRYKQEILNLREEVTVTQQQLIDSQETIQRLNRQLAEIEQAKKEYEKRQLELEHMLRQLEESKNIEASERQKLEEEIEAKQLEMQRIKKEVEAKDCETKRLQEEVELAKLRQEELMRQQQEEAARRQAEQLELERLAEAVKAEVPETIETSEQLKEEMKELVVQLLETRDESQMTLEDKIHIENLKDGKTKYKTLAEIRRGNTNRRIDMFESIVIN